MCHSNKTVSLLCLKPIAAAAYFYQTESQNPHKGLLGSRRSGVIHPQAPSPYLCDPHPLRFSPLLTPLWHVGLCAVHWTCPAASEATRLTLLHPSVKYLHKCLLNRAYLIPCLVLQTAPPHILYLPYQAPLLLPYYWPPNKLNNLLIVFILVCPPSHLKGKIHRARTLNLIYSLIYPK